MRDDDEFVAFVERSGGRLCDTAFLLCRDWDFAQDLTQITFVKVYLSWRRIRHEDPYGYSKKVLLRAYLDHKRLKSSAELRTGTVPDRAAAADAAELRLTLLGALGQLSPRDRAIIVLRYWEDHSIQTVSELLDLSPGVVKVQSVRALARLRVLLGEDEARRLSRLNLGRFRGLADFVCSVQPGAADDVALDGGDHVIEGEAGGQAEGLVEGEELEHVGVGPM